MNSREKLAILTAMKKSVETAIKDARAEVDARMWEDYEDEGIEKKALIVGKQKVGEIGISYTTPKFEVTDKNAFEEFALDYGLATASKTIKPEAMREAVGQLERALDEETFNAITEDSVTVSGDWDKAMERVGDTVCYMDSGMVVPGVAYVPKRPKNTTVRGCDPKDVLPIVAALPGGVEALLIGGDVA